jgi:hypothetical protein
MAPTYLDTTLVRHASAALASSPTGHAPALRNTSIEVPNRARRTVTTFARTSAAVAVPDAAVAAVDVDVDDDDGDVGVVVDVDVDVDIDVDVDVDADAKSLCSIASCRSDASSSCGYVRLTMFPLYVLEVREHWPESGRARKVVEIDTAIEMMKSRPEFYQVLIEVKEKGYHLKPHRRIRTEDGDVEDNI